MTTPLHAELKRNTDWWARAETLIRSRNKACTENNKSLYYADKWTHTRVIQQQALLMDMLKQIQDKNIPCDGKALFVGGMPGSGKSTLLSSVVRLKDYFIVDPDDIKEEMIKAGMCPTYDDLTPMEHGPFVHYESTQIAKQLLKSLSALKCNIVYPMTFANPEAVETRVTACRQNNYTEVAAMYVHVRLDTSTRRVKARHKEGIERWLDGKGMGGRFIDLDNVGRDSTGRCFSHVTKMFDWSRRLDNDFDLI